jgi:hypothetical protein
VIALLNVLFGLSLLAAIPAYALYFISLHHFGKSLQQQHPDLYSRFGSESHLNQSYAALRAIRQDPVLSAQLEPPVAAQLKQTYRYLVIGLGCFMVLLFAGLAGSVIAKA